MFDPMRPFTRAQALAAGLSDHDLRGPDFRRLLVGVHVSSRVPDSPFIWACAALCCFSSSAVLTHSSNARLYGAPVPQDPLEHVTVPHESERRSRAGLRCHVAALEAADVRLMHGLRVSGPERLFFELAEALTLVDLVVLGDWLVRRGWTTPAALVEYCGSHAGRHARLARRAASYVRERVDSPMETRLRMLLVLAGLPEPQVNLKIHDENGTVVMRLDLSWPKVRLAVEYDGRQHLEDPEQWERDVERREDLGDPWRLMRVTRKGIYDTPEITLQRVWKALKDRGWRGLQPLRDEWRPHFRGR